MPLRAMAAGEQGWGRIVATLEAALADVDQDEMSLASSWEALMKNPDVFAMEDLITLLQKWLGDLVSRQMAGRARFFAGADAIQRRLLARSSVPGLAALLQSIAVRPPAGEPPTQPPPVSRRYRRPLSGHFRHGASLTLISNATR